MNIKYEYNNKVENINITNYKFYQNNIYNEKVAEVIKNIMDIRNTITKIYSIDTIRLIIDKLDNKVKMEIVFNYIDKDNDEHTIEMLFDDSNIHIDLGIYIQNEKLVKDIKLKYKKISKILK
jgi:CRISPR/Cas system-associated endoribonuclease Cas2